MQEEIRELKKRVVEFEQSYSEAEKESKTRLQEAEEAQMKVSQLQETIERYLISKVHIFDICVVYIIMSIFS